MTTIRLFAIVFAAITALCPTPLQAQHHDTHTHSLNELGFSAAAAYEIEHKEWLPALHLHYFRTLALHSRWALGGGIEYIPGKENHFELGCGIRYRPTDKIHISLMPGISITHQINFSAHAELSYEAIQIGHFNLGPVASYAWTKGHSLLSAGIHLAYSFR